MVEERRVINNITAIALLFTKLIRNWWSPVSVSVLMLDCYSRHTQLNASHRHLNYWNCNLFTFFSDWSEIYVRRNYISIFLQKV